MADDRDRIPLIFQAALASTPLLFIGLPAWLLVVVLRLFDIDWSVPVGVVMACVLPVALFLFARLCAKHNLIKSTASPVAIAVLQSAAAAFSLWLVPRLPDGWRSSVGPGGRDEGNAAGVLMAAMIFVAGWIALAVFSGRESRGDAAPSVEAIPPREDAATRARRLPP